MSPGRRQPSATSGQIEGDASPLSLWVTEIKVPAAAAAAAAFLPSFLSADECKDLLAA